MTEQTKQEVMKAIAYGMDNQTIEEATDVPAAEIAQIRQTCAKEIAAKKEYLVKAGYIHA